MGRFGSDYSKICVKIEIFPLSAKSFMLDLQKKGMEWYQEHMSAYQNRSQQDSKTSM